MLAVVFFLGYKSSTPPRTALKAGVNICKKLILEQYMACELLVVTKQLGKTMWYVEYAQAKKNFNTRNILRDAAKVLAQKMMNAADNDFKISNDHDILDIGVSVDGSWQRSIFLPEMVS